MGEIKIREATVDDCKACHELSGFKELLMASGERIPLSYFKDIATSDAIFFVAEKDGEVVGYSTANILPGKVALLQLLAVDSKLQNKGIGKKLVKRIEEECLKKDVRWILGYAPKFSEKALAFYKNIDFTLGGEMIEILKEIRAEDLDNS